MIVLLVVTKTVGTYHQLLQKMSVLSLFTITLAAFGLGSEFRLSWPQRCIFLRHFGSYVPPTLAQF